MALLIRLEWGILLILLIPTFLVLPMALVSGNFFLVLKRSRIPSSFQFLLNLNLLPTGCSLSFCSGSGLVLPKRDGLVMSAESVTSDKRNPGSKDID